eukprot:TRINITY_DN41982_c0_g1_i1.p1 TRINITY_DN41982_c0_g1~~TRINITY_DN41982_c0_g1_i1.p1  ORF type:complete len:793 (+),score=181.73 TRINITY_DN41982_c0_g1_i1:86-2464(+)
MPKIASLAFAIPWRLPSRARAACREFCSLSASSSASAPTERPERHRKAKPQRQRKKPQGAAAWGTEEDDIDEPLVAHGRRQIAFREDAAVAQHALHWHRVDVQRNQDVMDSLRHASCTKADRWWESWEAEWDEDWDWEEKWAGIDNQIATGQDDPRRPKGPLLQLAGSSSSSYSPVAALNHSQLTRAMVAARQRHTEELEWQALCRRADLVAVAMTPAELLAVCRCVGERQSGQLKLLWKLASLVVERVNAFTAEDLACLANVYSSGEAVHHGMLNVVALVLANEEDERVMGPLLAEDVLSSFARANYPLPLLLGEFRRIVLSADDGVVPLLPSRVALRALHSLVQLKALDEELLAVLLPLALGVSQSGFSSAPSFPEACNAASWACSARQVLLSLSPNSSTHAAASETSQALTVTDVPSRMSGEEALVRVLQVLRATLAERQLSFLKVVPTMQAAPLCVIPERESISASQVDGHALLSAAELLMAEGTKEDALQVSDLLKAAVGSSASTNAWSLQDQVRWLHLGAAVGIKAAGVLPPAVVETTLTSILAKKPGELVSSAASLALLLPRLVDTFGTAIAAATTDVGIALCKALLPDLFRLRLSEAREASQGCLQLATRLPKVAPLSATLLQATIDGLPAKIKAECVFHKRGGQGPGGPEIAAWCSLLADNELHGAESPEEIWLLLAEEAKRALAASGLGKDEDDPSMSGAVVAIEVLEALRRVKRNGWSASDPATPLGAVFDAVQREWRRATAIDGVELEDAEHEALPIIATEEHRLRVIFQEVGVQAPTDC